MTLSVTLLTERDQLAQQWQQALGKHGIESKVVAPTDLANAVSGQAAVVVDVDGAHLDADELLATIGYVRASGVLPIAHVDRDRDALEDIVTELCYGLVTSDDRDVAQVAAVVGLAEGDKCQRCWRILPEVGAREDAPGTCGRCADVLRGQEAAAE